MSNRRRSAFSVYKTHQVVKKDTIDIQESDNASSEMDKIETNGKPSPSGAKKRHNKKDVPKGNDEVPKQFSRASKLRHSIGNIGLNKKKRKMKSKQVERQDHESTDSEEGVKRAKTVASVSKPNCSKVDMTDNVEELDKSLSKDVESLPRKTFEWLISPVKSEKFFSDLWEKKPLLVKRHERNYYEGIFSTNEMDKILRENNVKFSVNLDVTSYKDGKRETHNPQGRAQAPVVWDFYQNGCSVRLLNPQTFSHSVWKLNSTLQEYFGSFVGANVYLTPPNTQGFAPHYDDIEAFILQLEGKKHWRVYSGRNDNEVLPRLSSGNFDQSDIAQPILDVTLEPGDLLYFPRGMIHQADTVDGPHSLHITLSTYQQTCWGDFMEKLVPRALQIAIDEDVEFRRGLPLGYLKSMGVASSESTSNERTEFFRHVEKLLMKLVSYLPVDGAVDQMGIKNVHDSLPPVLSKEETDCSVFGAGARWKEDHITNEVNIDENTSLRLVRKEAIRLVSEEEGLVVYHSLENSRIYHEQEPQFVELTFEALPILEQVIKIFPNYVKVKNLPGDDIDFKVDLATVLYEKGILITKKPLRPKTDS